MDTHLSIHPSISPSFFIINLCILTNILKKRLEITSKLCNNNNIAQLSNLPNFKFVFGIFDRFSKYFSPIGKVAAAEAGFLGRA